MVRRDRDARTFPPHSDMSTPLSDSLNDIRHHVSRVLRTTDTLSCCDRALLAMFERLPLTRCGYHGNETSSCRVVNFVTLSDGSVIQLCFVRCGTLAGTISITNIVPESGRLFGIVSTSRVYAVSNEEVGRMVSRVTREEFLRQRAAVAVMAIRASPTCNLSAEIWSMIFHEFILMIAE